MIKINQSKWRKICQVSAQAFASVVILTMLTSAHARDEEAKATPSDSKTIEELKERVTKLEKTVETLQSHIDKNGDWVNNAEKLKPPPDPTNPWTCKILNVEVKGPKRPTTSARALEECNKKLGPLPCNSALIKCTKDD